MSEHVHLPFGRRLAERYDHRGGAVDRDGVAEEVLVGGIARGELLRRDPDERVDGHGIDCVARVEVDDDCTVAKDEGARELASLRIDDEERRVAKPLSARRVVKAHAAVGVGAHGERSGLCQLDRDASTCRCGPQREALLDPEPTDHIRLVETAAMIDGAIGRDLGRGSTARSEVHEASLAAPPTRLRAPS